MIKIGMPPKDAEEALALVKRHMEALAAVVRAQLKAKKEEELRRNSSPTRSKSVQFDLVILAHDTDEDDSSSGDDAVMNAMSDSSSGDETDDEDEDKDTEVVSSTSSVAISNQVSSISGEEPVPTLRLRRQLSDIGEGGASDESGEDEQPAPSANAVHNPMDSSDDDDGGLALD
jgi:hypothetical protein